MSLTVERLDLVSVIDPRVDVGARARRQYGVLSSGSENTWKQFPSTSFNNNTITWSSNPPNKRIFVNRRVYMTVQFQIIITGQSAGAGIALLQAAGLPTAPGVSAGTQFLDAPRCQPLSQALQTVKVMINNGTLSTNLGGYFRGLTRYHNGVAVQDGEMSTTATMPDQSQNYSDLQGFARDPLRGYGDNPLQCPRGGFVGCTIIQNPTNGLPGQQAIVNMTVTEPIYLSPFLFGEQEENQAFVGIETLDINATLGGRGTSAFSGLLGSIWSHSTANTSVITAAVANVVSATLLFNYITPDLTASIPPMVNYALYDVNYLQTQNFAPVASGAGFQALMNTVSLSSVPTRVYVWVSPQDNAMDWTKTDTYYGITNVNITFENRDSLLANASQVDLYEMSARNGCNLSFRQWTRDVGSVLCISFANDLALPALQAPGLRGKFNFSMTVQATNLGSAPSIPSLSVLVVSEGVLAIGNGQIYQSQGVLDEKDVLRTKESGVGMEYKPSMNVYGGGFWQDFQKWAKRIGRAAIDVGKSYAPPQYQPAIAAADQLAAHAGFGGRLLSRSQMRQLM